MVRLALAGPGLILAGSALALEVGLGPIREGGGHVWADVRLSELFSPRVEESLSRGMPATLHFHAELWRRRSLWFDRMESSFDASVKMRHEAWSQRYRIEWTGRPPLSVPSIDSLRNVLVRPRALRVVRVGQLRPGPRYYVLVSVTLEPLSVEDIEEGEGWLSGEVENQRGSGFGIITAIPRSLFDAVRNFAGFGDQHARAQSEDFKLEDLFPTEDSDDS